MIGTARRCFAAGVRACEAAAAASEPIAVRHRYFVPRVGKTGDSLPVYTDVRNGGTRCQIEIRKVQGDVQALRKELLVSLSHSGPSPLAPEPSPRAGRKLHPKTGRPTATVPVQLSKVTHAGKIVVKGNKVREIKAFLESRGF